MPFYAPEFLTPASSEGLSSGSLPHGRVVPLRLGSGPPRLVVVAWTISVRDLRPPIDHASDLPVPMSLWRS